MSELLYQILLAVLIVAVVFLIFVLWRLYNVLTDLNTASDIIAKKVTAIGLLIDDTISMIENLKHTAQGFLNSIKNFGAIKEKLSDFWEDDSKKKKGADNAK